MDGEAVRDVAGNSWYSSDLPNIPPRTRELFENYSKIAPDEVLNHVSNFRDKAWAVHQYPCIGQWRFLDSPIEKLDCYPEVVSRMQTGTQTFLDLGCAVGTDLRRLVADGVDSSLCYGVDLETTFIDLGYDLFRDRETLNTKFIAANVLDEQSPLDQLDGKVDILGVSSFFHLFPGNQHKAIVRRMIRLLKARPDSMVIGRQFANETPGERDVRYRPGTSYRHNLETWHKLWTEIGEELGIKFDVQAKAEQLPEGHYSPDGAGAFRLQFCIRRV